MSFDFSTVLKYTNEFVEYMKYADIDDPKCRTKRMKRNRNGRLPKYVVKPKKTRDEKDDGFVEYKCEDCGASTGSERCIKCDRIREDLDTIAAQIIDELFKK